MELAAPDSVIVIAIIEFIVPDQNDSYPVSVWHFLFLSFLYGLVASYGENGIIV